MIRRLGGISLVRGPFLVNAIKNGEQGGELNAVLELHIISRDYAVMQRNRIHLLSSKEFRSPVKKRPEESIVYCSCV